VHPFSLHSFRLFQSGLDSGFTPISGQRTFTILPPKSPNRAVRRKITSYERSQILGNLHCCCSYPHRSFYDLTFTCPAIPVGSRCRSGVCSRHVDRRHLLGMEKSEEIARNKAERVHRPNPYKLALGLLKHPDRQLSGAGHAGRSNNICRKLQDLICIAPEGN